MRKENKVTAERELEKGISEIVGALCDPIIVFPGGWGDTLPDWLKTAITLERLIENMKVIKGEEMTGTDAEACAYLYTASLTQPLDHDWAQIYLYIATKVYEKQRTPQSGVTMPEDIRVDKISDDQMRDLNRLKGWIYQRRVKARLEGDRADRRQKKAEKAARDKMIQPELFTLNGPGEGKVANP